MRDGSIGVRCPWHKSPAGCGGSPSGLLFPSPLWHVSLHWLGHQMAASGLIYFSLADHLPCPHPRAQKLQVQQEWLVFSLSLCGAHGITCWISSVLRRVFSLPYHTVSNRQPRALHMRAPLGHHRRRIQDGIRSGLAPCLRSRYNTHPGFRDVSSLAPVSQLLRPHHIGS